MWHYLRIGEFVKSVEVCDAGIKLADELGARPVQYFTIKALALLNLGRYGEAWDALQREVTEESFGQAMHEFGLAYYLESVLACEQAAEQARKVARIATDLNRAWMRTGAQNLRVTSLARLDSLDDATLTEIEQDLQSFGGTLGRQARSEAMLSIGSLEEALELAEAAVDSAEKTGMKLDLIRALELKLRILLELENMAEALVVADNAFEQAYQTEYRSMLWRIQANRARARKAAGDESGAKQDFQTAAAIARELAESIPDEKLRQSFETNPLVAAILKR
jgi:tetratricopeptide (TPR) repeat protein